MSLLKLSKTQDSEWYTPVNTYPFGKKSFLTKKFSPREKTMRRCKEISFYSSLLPVIKTDVWKFFDKVYVYSQIIDIVIQKNPHNAINKNSIRRTARLV